MLYNSVQCAVRDVRCALSSAGYMCDMQFAVCSVGRGTCNHGLQRAACSIWHAMSDVRPAVPITTRMPACVHLLLSKGATEAGVVKVGRCSTS